MFKSSIEKDPNDANKFYYNGIQFNNSNVSAVPAEIDATLQSPLLDRSSDYEVSVVRLFVSGNALPIFIVPVIRQEPPYETKYIASMSYNGFTVSRSVVYTPLNNVCPFAYGCEQLFYIYTYQQWLDNINSAYLECYNALVALPSGIQAIASSPPIFIYDTNNNLISYYVESSYETGPAGINVYMNKLLFDFFVSFEASYDSLGYQNPQSLDVQLIITNSNSFRLQSTANIPPKVASILPPSPFDVWKIQQEYESVFSWNIVRSLVLTSNIGTISESIPNIDLGNGNTDDTTRSNLQILTDFDLDFSSGNRAGARGYIQYLPTAEFRWTSIVRGGALSRINVKVQYLTFTNEIKNLYINPNFSFTIKLLFRKKVPLIKL